MASHQRLRPAGASGERPTVPQRLGPTPCTPAWPMHAVMHAHLIQQMEHPHRVAAGDIMDPGPDGSKLAAALTGADAVVFVAGPTSMWQVGIIAGTHAALPSKACRHCSHHLTLQLHLRCCVLRHRRRAVAPPYTQLAGAT